MYQLATLFFTLTVLFGYSQVPDSITNKLQELPSNQEQGKYLLDLGKNTADPKASISIFETARNLTGLDDSLKIAILSTLGSNYLFIYQNDSGESVLTGALKRVSNTEFLTLRADIYNGLGNLARNRSQNELAINNYIEGLNALKRYKTKHAELVKIKLTGNIAGVYYDLEKYDQALKYATESKQLIYKNQVEYKYLIANLMMAFSYRALGQLDSALFYNNNVLEISRSDSKQSYYLPHALYNTAAILKQKGDLEKSLQRFEEAILVSKKQGELEVQVSCIISIGQIMIEQKRYQEALVKARKAYEIARENSFLPKQVEALEIEAVASEMLKNYQKSLQSYKKLTTLKDSLFNIETVSKVEEINAKYQTEIKEAEITQLSSENKIRELQSIKDARTKLILIIGLIALLIIAILLYSRFKTKTKINNLLNSKNNELARLNQTKDRLFSIISHDLKSPVSSFHTITKSLTENWEHLEKNQLKSFIESLRDSSENVRDMMDNLLKWALAQTDQLTCQKESIDPGSVIEKVETQLKNVAELKQIQLKKEINSQEKMTGDWQFVEIVIRNILSNALKFSKISNEIFVAVNHTKNKQIITISDKGVGMSQSAIEQLLKGEILAQDIKNSSEKGTGLGLALCKELMDKMGAEMEVNSQKNKGTSFKLIFDRAA